MTDHHSDDENTVPFYPDHFFTEVRVTIGLVAVLLAVGVLGLLRPPELGPAANPMDTPLHIKPEWYFLALYQIIKYIPKTIGATLPVILVGIVVAWPFIDRKPDTSRRQYWLRAAGLAVALLGAVVLSYLAWVS